MICDAANPFQGARVETVGEGTGELSLCEDTYAVFMPGGSLATLSCGSLTIAVEQGSVEIPLPEGVGVVVPAGATAILDDLDDGSFSIRNSPLSMESVDVAVGGLMTRLGPGSGVAIGPSGEVVDLPVEEALSLLAGGQFHEWRLGATSAAAVFSELKIAWLFNPSAKTWTSFIPQLGVTNFPLTDGIVLWLVTFAAIEIPIG